MGKTWKTFRGSFSRKGFADFARREKEEYDRMKREGDLLWQIGKKRRR